jgi:DNA-directed RNA polymerase subunit RPC12/RpoP
MLKVLDLFTSLNLPQKPKRARMWRMRVADAGHGCIQFKCPRCGHDTGWLQDTRTITENKRGIVCPICNKHDLKLKSPEGDTAAAEHQVIGLTQNFQGAR